MERWEYCYVVQLNGAAHVYFLQDADKGYQIENLTEPGISNAAKVIARLGIEGWEAIRCDGPFVDLSGRPNNTSWYLKRRISKDE
jgi:hypothetical protein